MFPDIIRCKASVLLSVALLIAACSRPGSAGVPSTLKQIDKAALQAAVTNSAKELMVPGALVFLRTPQGEFTITYGTNEIGTASPPAADTHFRIASNTKTMTAAVIMQLAQENKLNVEDPISKYVQGVPNGEHITLAELLKMRSGLYSYTDDPILSATMDTDPAKVWTTAEVLAIAFAHPPNFPPDAQYEYNNTNYALLGLVAEKIDGKPLAQMLHDRLFGPLDLRNTELPVSNVNTLPEPYAHGYLYGSSSVALTGEPPYSAEVQAAARAGTLLPKDYTGINHSFASAAGGVISDANDLATWIKALVTGRVLDPAQQRRWLDSLQPEDPNKPQGQKYGYGIAQLSWGPNTIYFHGGETPGYNSKISYDTANDLTLIVWTNLTISLDGQQTANTLWIKVLDQIYKVSPLAPSPAPAN